MRYTGVTGSTFGLAAISFDAFGNLGWHPYTDKEVKTLGQTQDPLGTSGDPPGGSGMYGLGIEKPGLPFSSLLPLQLPPRKRKEHEWKVYWFSWNPIMALI